MNSANRQLRNHTTDRTSVSIYKASTRRVEGGTYSPVGILNEQPGCTSAPVNHCAGLGRTGKASATTLAAGLSTVTWTCDLRSQRCQFIQNDITSTNSPSHKKYDGSVLGESGWAVSPWRGRGQWSATYHSTAWPVATVRRRRRQSVLSPSLCNFITLGTRLFAPLAHSQLFRSVPPKINKADCGNDPRAQTVCVYMRSPNSFDTDAKAVKLWQGQYCIGNPLDLNKYLKL